MEFGNTHFDIIEACRRGDRQSQFELYRLYSKAMYNICLRIVNNETDAEDLLQNSFIDVFTKLQSFRHESSIGAWMKRIVINNCINFLKKKKVYFEELNEKFQSIPEKGNGEDDEINGLNVSKINRAIYNLPEGYRVVFSLYAMEGYDHQEIGEILNISESTSKSQYSRAKKKLKELLLTEVEEIQ